MNSLPGSLDESSNTTNLPLKESYFVRDDVPPVLETNKYWLLNVLRDELTWLCPVEREGKKKREREREEKGNT
jgi:AP-3 complex subunit mu